ncbi:catecholate siderophore receptor Fiu [Roseateles depolymerans]|uniref:TonB-dependent receptor n=1 Tax=Roseateles depolymerans TaxID=76731 RepID=A0A0U3D665_9BURK|nr:catecholate siderophore receptor Fiu [Roseateles depolymerans]ALV09126.1 TonB-dependent receptor [Roseateles depolymerans]REG13880.1 catecholate siderophore receptor [Roseateles depolymerans]
MATYIKSRKHAVAPLAALAASFALPMVAQADPAPAPAAAETTPSTSSSTFLPTVRVDGTAASDYKVDKSASSKLTQPLLETPKTIQVIRKEVLREQGAVSLMDALQNTPGITMQLGENGNTSAGDTFQMRGFSASTSTFVDGIRDLGAVTRDVFNTEQIEVVKGPAGADTGRAASAGYINLISKLPQADSFIEGTATVGTADRKRASVDVNQKLAEGTAVRLNAVWEDSGVPGRDVVKKKTYGLAPSVAFGLGTPTRFYLYSQHIRQNNLPDGGIPAIGWPGYSLAATVTEPARSALLSARKVDTSNFYGSVHDYEDVKADMVTTKLEMDLGGGTTVRNIARYGRTYMDRTVTGIINITAVTPADPNTWTISRSRQHINQTNEILTNQTSLSTSFTTAGVKHDLATGIELTYESQDNKAFTATPPTGQSAVPAANLYNPNPYVDLGGSVRNPAGDTSGSTTTQAIYALDTVSLTDALKLTLGLRTDHYTSKYATATASFNAGKWVTSWNTALLYKLADNGTVYAAAANSILPPGGSNFTLAASGQNATASDPQEAKNYEVGTKWDLLNKRLNLTAALYRSENDGQVSVDPVTNVATQGGKTRVEGIELAAVGQLTNFWQITAGVQTMNTKQINQRSVNTTTGVQTITDGVRWSPKWSATLWTSYQWGDFTFGGGVSHTAEQKRVITVAAAPSTGLAALPAYTVVNAMAAYRVNKNVNLQLNVTNLLDKQYMSSLNNGGVRVGLGAPRTTMLTANFGF